MLGYSNYDSMINVTAQRPQLFPATIVVRVAESESPIFANL